MRAPHLGLVLALAAACGRINYDPIGDADVDDAGSDVDRPDPGVCPTGYTAMNGTCYRVVAAPQPWAAAEADCEDDGPWAHLVTIVDAPEHFVLHDLSTAASLSEIWIGYTDRRAQNVYRWVSAGGTDPSTDLCFWGSGGPPDDVVQNCAVQLGPTQCGDWLVRDCAVARGYICESDGNPADPSAY